MFPGRYFNERMFARRYFPKAGSSVVLVYGPLFCPAGKAFISGAQQAAVYLKGAAKGDVFVPGAQCGSVT
jgi:hypothetical protein